jgi:adenylosuccinate lyase
MIARYSRPEMSSLWSGEARYNRWLEVELYALEGMVEAGLVPGEAYADCAAKAGTISASDVPEIEEIERTTKHDVIAFLTFMEQRIGPSARFMHMGMTSSDVLDTSLAIQMKAAGQLLLAELAKAMSAVEHRAFEHKSTPMMGRTHGIHAEPITFGLKLAGWYAELERNRERLRRACDAVSTGKVSGAVGTFAHLPPSVEAHVCRRAGLHSEGAATQVVARDRHAEFFSALALLGSSLERFAVEIRHLQRTEVREVEEPFTTGQKGSSAMPHKRNPILSENLTGLARLLRGYAVAALEDVPLWHERDISHSSVERVIAPDATIAAHFMLHRFTGLVSNLRVYPERMKANLDALGGLVFSQAVLLELAKRGMDRQAAYAIVQRNAMKFYESGTDFRTALLADGELTGTVPKAAIEACFDLSRHLSQVDAIFSRVFGRTTA